MSYPVPRLEAVSADIASACRDYRVRLGGVGAEGAAGAALTLRGCNFALGSAARRVPIGAAFGRIGLTPKAGSDVVTSGGASKALVPHEVFRRGQRVEMGVCR